MANAALYTSNTSSTAVTAGSVIPIGSAVHGYGCGIDLNGNIITLTAGYYKVSVNATATASAAGNIVVTLQQDGAPIIGATQTAQATAADEVINISYAALVFVRCNSITNLTALLTGTDATVNNFALTVERIR